LPENRISSTFEKIPALSKVILPGKLDKWTSALMEGAEDPIIFLILTLCPNIKFFDFCDEHDHGLDFGNLVKYGMADTKRKLPVLSNLKYVDLDWEYSYTNSLDAVAFFAGTMPSVVSIKVHGLPLSIDVPILDDQSPRSSNLKDLSFECSEMNTKDLNQVLQGIHALRSFRYIYIGDRSFDLSLLLVAIPEPIKDSLESLILSTGNHKGINVGRLQEFKVLKHLKVDSSFYFKRRSPPETVVFDLPSSIESITICDILEADDDDLEVLVLDILRAKAKRFPRLTLIMLYAVDKVADCVLPNYDHTWKACEDVGLTLRILPGTGY